MASKNTTSIASAKPKQNPALPRVSITLDGDEYYLQFSFNAIAVAEQLTGINLFGSFDFTQLSATKFRAMLFASLLHNHPKMTIEKAGSFITAFTLADITVKMVEAWHGSRPEVKEAEGNVEAEAEDGDVIDTQSN
jgi:hypothetical protein